MDDLNNKKELRNIAGIMEYAKNKNIVRPTPEQYEALTRLAIKERMSTPALISKLESLGKGYQNILEKTKGLKLLDMAKKIPGIGAAAIGLGALASGDAGAAVGDIAIPGGIEGLGEGEDEQMLKLQEEDRKRRALEALAKTSY